MKRLRLLFEDAALRDLEDVATSRQIERVMGAMEKMARVGWSLGPAAPAYAAEYRRDIHHWPVPPLGVFSAIEERELVVVMVRHGRQMRRRPY